MKDDYKELTDVLSKAGFTDIEIHDPIDSNILCKSPTGKTVCITLYPERYHTEELQRIKDYNLTKYDRWICLTIHDYRFQVVEAVGINFVICGCKAFDKWIEEVVND